MKRLLPLLALVACAHVPFNGPAGLPPIPDAINSALGPVSIVLQDTLVNEDGRALMGGFQPSNRVIYMHKRITERLVLWQILYHESCHVTLWDTGLRNFFNSAEGMQMADVLCDAFATARVAEMQAALKK